MRISVIHNPNAGDDDHSAEQLIALLTRAGHGVTYFTSRSPWQATLADRCDLLVVAGGDGTVGEVVRATAGRAIPIAVLPMGTANNIARWLGLTGIPLEELVADWARPSLQPFDVGVARGPWGDFRFLESIGIGLLAGVMAEIEGGPAAYVNQLNGRETRIIAAREVFQHVLRRSSALKSDIQVDGRNLSGEYLLLEVLNFGAAGPNLQLAPDADGADGLLDVVLIEAHERAWLADHLVAIDTDSPTAPALPVLHARRVTIQCEGCRVHLDDELWPERSDALVAEIWVEPAAVTFVVPPNAAQRRGRRTP